MKMKPRFKEDDVVMFATRDEYDRMGSADVWVPCKILQQLDRFGGREVTICEVDTEDGPGKTRYSIYEDEERWMFPECLFSLKGDE